MKRCPEAQSLPRMGARRRPNLPPSTCHMGPATQPGALPPSFHSGFFCSSLSLMSVRPARPPISPSVGRASSNCRALGSQAPSRGGASSS